MKLDPRNLDEFVDEEDNGGFSNHVKNKKKHVPNEFRKVNNKKFNKPKRVQKNFDED